MRVRCLLLVVGTGLVLMTRSESPIDILVEGLEGLMEIRSDSSNSETLIDRQISALLCKI
jgi:hypothetical protein